LGLSDETGAAFKAIRGLSGASKQLAALGVAQGKPRAAEPLRSARSAASPPSSNTGGYSKAKPSPGRGGT
jgi:hypothetical protein